MATLIKDDADDKKRKQEDAHGKASKTKAPKTLNEYAGYSFQKELDPKIDTIRKDVSGSDFFDQYVSQRKPCVLDYLPTSKEKQSIEITRSILEKVAGDKTIQVERRPDNKANFGQNRTEDRQVMLTIHELLQKILDSDEGELYYWSTQEDTDDPYNVPCRQLVDSGKIPLQVDWAGNLILSSCNLWMGKAKEGASSGLHHDYHDNFYCLLRGRKRFRLLSPDCAPHLATYGTIDRIHSNGRVSYVGNEARADGVPLDSLEEEEEEVIESIGDDNDDDDDDEEEVVLGHGFDYVSDSEEEFDETKDDFEEIMLDENGKEVDKLTRPPPPNASTTDDHPDSFSRINPCLSDQTALQKEFPGYASCKQVMIDLKAGQVLYLPAGWFHEVTSYSSDEEKEEKKSDTVDTSLGGCHMALNYWYHPPDALDNYDNPYKNSFWRLEEQQRLIEKRQNLKV